ncbi:MAG: lyase family protein, partial [Candidatus Vogelbacteria bacterium]|nr:lyase family protein [Candidatus Vogelbacteria bacterium]
MEGEKEVFNELERYTLAPMKDWWGREETKFEWWLKVELAVIDAYVVLGRLTINGAAYIRHHAKFDLVRMRELEAKYGHDMIAFVETVRESLVGTPAEPFAHWFHLEVTSYNIEDPALILRLRQSTEAVIGEAQKLQAMLDQRAEELQNLAMIMCTHGQDAQPDTFGHLLKVYAAQIGRCWRRLQRSLDDDLVEGNISGATGHYNEISPAVEKIALHNLGLVPAEAATQILQRDRHAALMSHLSHTTSAIGQMCSTFWIMMHSGIRELQEPRKKDHRGSSAMPHKRN